MKISEYTPQRARVLNKLNILSEGTPANIKILWFDVLSSKDVENRTYTGIYSHAHSFYEVHFVFNGTVCYEDDGNPQTLKSGEALIITPETPHRYISCDKNLIKTSLAFSIDEDTSHSLCFSDIKTKKFAFSDYISENTNFILKLCEKKDIFVPHLIYGRILEIIYQLLRTLNISLPETRDTRTDSRVLVAKDFIRHNNHRIIKCEDVAKECCLSSKQLNRLFKKATDKSLSEYITTTKLNYGKKLLSDNNHSIKEVGYILGFENESSFVSFFKRHCGVTPGAFKKQNS